MKKMLILSLAIAFASCDKILDEIVPEYCDCTVSLLSPNKQIIVETDHYLFGDCDKYKTLRLNNYVTELNRKYQSANPLTRSQWLEYLTFDEYCE